MVKFTGFVDETPDGRTRIFLRDDPFSYVDVEGEGLAAAEAAGEELVYIVTLKEGAQTVSGRLSQEQFEGYFTLEDNVPRAYSSFYHTTKFWKCKHSISIC